MPASPARSSWRPLWPALLLLAGAAPVAAQDLTRVPVDRRVAAHMHFLAADDLGGRETGSLEGLITAHYVAAAMRSAGLEAAGEEGYLQPYPLVGSMLQLESTRLHLSDQAGAVDLSLVPFDDFLVRGYSGPGFEQAGGLVFAGHGIVTDAIDDYAGLDVSGRFVVILGGRPEGVASSSNWRTRRQTALERDAAGLLYVPEEGGGGRSARILRFAESSMRRRWMSLGGTAEEAPEPGFPQVFLRRDAARRLLAAGGVDLQAEERRRRSVVGLPGMLLPGLRLSLRAPVVVEEYRAYNAVGLIRGSDPELADEVVVVSAHMDHVGRDDEGNVYNGADDNATGTSTLMIVAEVLAANPPPRRSVLFLAFSGEEKGLLGSRWWVEHPTLELSRVVGNVNVDMVGRNAPFELGATPSPDHSEHNTLVTRSLELAPRAGLELTWETGEGEYRRKADSYFYRSDHANFAGEGIPVVFFFAGEHADYHQTSDTLDKVDLAKVGRVVAFVSMLVTEVANDPERPRLLKR